MKLPTIRLLLSLLLAIPIGSHAQMMTDPLLAGAVTTQNLAMSDAYKERTKKQNAILAAEAAITTTMEKVHYIENKVVDYLANAQGAVQNLHQIKRAGELAIVEIPQNLKELAKAIPKHPKGAAIAAICSSEMKDAATEAASLYPLIAQLVSSGSYNVTTAEGTTEKKKVNLLNAAERYYIANEVVQKLETINMSIYLLAWQVRTMTFNDLFFHLTPDTWCNVMTTKYLVQDIIDSYSSL